VKPVFIFLFCVAVVLSAILSQPSAAAERDTGAVSGGRSTNSLTQQQWKQLDAVVDRGLLFLSGKQQSDGSFEAVDTGQPGITALCVMAFLSRGHLPGKGPYGKQLSRAIDYTLSTQQPSGMFWKLEFVRPHSGKQGIYNHGIAGLMLSEVYGMTDAEQQQRIRAAILKAIALTRRYQLGRKNNPIDKGGWRYPNLQKFRNSDVSSTSWQLMFLRSARNAEFEVPKQYIDEALAYIKRSFNHDKRVWEYPLRGRTYVSAGVVGSGIVSLVLGGEQESEIARQAGDWVLTYDFSRYNRTPHRFDRYHYSAFYCSQAVHQLGGKYWKQFYPPLMQILIDNQNRDGSWPQERQKDAKFGKVYTSAFAILALTPPYNILPIYQR
jgi:hypothetical protein